MPLPRGVGSTLIRYSTDMDGDSEEISFASIGRALIEDSSSLPSDSKQSSLSPLLPSVSQRRYGHHLKAFA